MAAQIRRSPAKTRTNTASDSQTNHKPTGTPPSAYEVCAGKLSDVPPKRCSWVDANDELMREYHDREWGVPTHDDRRHFEFLILEGAQAGLSWSIVLRKREGYRLAFSQF